MALSDSQLQNKKMNIVTFGEIMLRLTPPGYQRFSQASSFDVVYGGGEANVAISLANYGLQVEFVSRLPENDIGQSALMTLRKHSVGTTHILRGGKRLGIYFLEMGSVNRGSKVIYDRENSAISEIEPGMVDWERVMQDASWFHWTGITPAISENTAKVCLEAIKMANKKGLTVSTDLNFRKNLWKYGKSASEVMLGLVEGCDIILGNEEDAEKVFGIKPEGVDVEKGKVAAEAYESVCKQLFKKFPKAKKVIITLRGSINANHNTWSGVLHDGNRLFKAPDYNITHIVDRVGGGDSFMGGLICGLNRFPGDDQKSLNFAVAASCLKHTIYGDYNLVTADEVEKLMSGVSSGRVSR